MKHDDFLVEILTEELPPKSLLKLAETFSQQIKDRLQKADLTFTDCRFFATPRRLAVWVKELAHVQPEQMVERKGPALNAAFDAEGKPSQACIGFARSCGVTPDELLTIKTSQGEWVGFRQQVPGKKVSELMPTIIEQALTALPIAKRMRWSDSDVQFVRPVHSVVMLYGDQIIDATILGCKTNRTTRGHRFHAPDVITIPHASQYESLLKEKGFVIADFIERRDKILKDAKECVQKKLNKNSAIDPTPNHDEEFLNEVTGLVEWPVPLCGQFDKAFLNLPEEVLISSMKDHQRYFPIVGDAKLQPYFVTISNIQSHEPECVIHGNERVLRARLSDAAFFYEMDKKESLEQRVERLKGIVYQAKLGTLYDKTERLIKIANFIAEETVSVENAKRAAKLAKADLTTSMVGEFPELQGVMGYYYALHDGENEEVAVALKEHYMPRFANDLIPSKRISKIIAIADRIDTLTGYFGINQIPTGDKDPYGLRRAALGVLRILIEGNGEIKLDLKEVVAFAIDGYKNKLENNETLPQVLNFMQERLRAYYQDKGVSADVFAAVAALQVTDPADIDKRIKAVQAFKKLNEAEALSVANKRVSNILTKYVDTMNANTIDAALFESEAEKILADQLEQKSEEVKRLSVEGHYEKMLLQLAELRKPTDDFFDHVMVMTDDKPRRENRILLLRKLRTLFLQVADIALLQ